ncbi:hypothetical protein NEOLI_000827 [Neolecta irregularis DAH-3]|uniref:Uncharacterized protein n=1 Tax=Neolecta irregularis (strain DAH-3) TaxID=1198029 RepID=A0A1U7LRV6_NEOID|nr:hypothetical protein NEOLI_000827 [Neolecta irregularis DAH-3]|eukprot:OLL25251.1 hypothetical protein NEOLI_000827 [Neolecta irregularis DAH-3]
MSRYATIYECIDDKCTAAGFTTGYSSTGNRLRQQQLKPLAPDEYLRKEKKALEDLDFLDNDRNIPESDLLIAIHHYTAEYYDRNGLWRVGNTSMNGEALFAFGWLMQEYVQILIGEDACVFKNMEEGRMYETEDSGLSSAPEETCNEGDIQDDLVSESSIDVETEVIRRKRKWEAINNEAGN